MSGFAIRDDEDEHGSKVFEAMLDRMAASTPKDLLPADMFFGFALALMDLESEGRLTRKDIKEINYLSARYASTAQKYRKTGKLDL